MRYVWLSLFIAWGLLGSACPTSLPDDADGALDVPDGVGVDTRLPPLDVIPQDGGDPADGAPPPADAQLRDTASDPADTLVVTEDAFTSPEDSLTVPTDTFTGAPDTSNTAPDTLTQPVDTFTPPSDTFTPPADTFTPPSDTFTPPVTPNPTWTGCPPGVLCSATPLYTSRVGLWYTLWWRTSPDDTWALYSRYTPLLGHYSSGGSATFPSELADFAALRADFLLLDHTNGVGVDGGVLAAAARRVATHLDGAASPVHQAVAAGACFWVQGVPDPHGCMASEAQQLWQDHADPAAHASTFLVAGRPLLVLYTAPGANDAWSDARFTMGAATGRSAEASAAQLATGLWGWVFDEPSPVHPRVMGVTPGWNTAHLGRPTTPLPREANGMRFQRQWLRAIAHNPDAIVISSWNDFAEETAIQPATRHDAGAEAWVDAYGQESPSFYFEIARTYSLMRWGLAHGAYVKEVDRDEVYQVTASGLVHVYAMPHGHPVVNTPSGYLAQFPGWSAPPSCAASVGEGCVIAQPTDFGGYCWADGTFGAETLGYAGCACTHSGCDASHSRCSCAGPVGRVNCDGVCALASTPVTFGGACWPAYSFSAAAMGFSGCSCATGACTSPSAQCQCAGLPGVPVCAGDCD